MNILKSSKYRKKISKIELLCTQVGALGGKVDGRWNSSPSLWPSGIDSRLGRNRL